MFLNCRCISDDKDGEKATVIVDSTETNLMTLRRTIYLTIQSSLDFEECAHKLIKIQLKPGQEARDCDCCMYISCVDAMSCWCFDILVGSDVMSMHCSYCSDNRDVSYQSWNIL